VAVIHTQCRNRSKSRG